MIMEPQLAEYLAEIRKQVCSRCVERPPEGPPCAPLGKVCGVEQHLGEIIDAIHEVNSNLLEPYLVHDRETICEQCPFHHSSICPCPMDYLAGLLVVAVESVDKRRSEREEARERIQAVQAGREEVRRAYEEAAGTWTGCDWPTQFGQTGLNLQGWSSARAQDMAAETSDADQARDWKNAATWLAQVENLARQAQTKARTALAYAEGGKWPEALQQAEWAWALEFSTGRPFRRGFPLTWQKLRQNIESAYQAKRMACKTCPLGSED